MSALEEELEQSVKLLLCVDAGDGKYEQPTFPFSPPPLIFFVGSSTSCDLHAALVLQESGAGGGGVCVRSLHCTRSKHTTCVWGVLLYLRLAPSWVLLQSYR